MVFWVLFFLCLLFPHGSGTTVGVLLSNSAWQPCLPASAVFLPPIFPDYILRSCLHRTGFLGTPPHLEAKAFGGPFHGPTAYHCSFCIFCSLFFALSGQSKTILANCLPRTPWCLLPFNGGWLIGAVFTFYGICLFCFSWFFDQVQFLSCLHPMNYLQAPNKQDRIHQPIAPHAEDLWEYSPEGAPQPDLALKALQTINCLLTLRAVSWHGFARTA